MSEKGDLLGGMDAAAEANPIRLVSEKRDYKRRGGEVGTGGPCSDKVHRVAAARHDPLLRS